MEAYTIVPSVDVNYICNHHNLSIAEWINAFINRQWLASLEWL